MNKAAVSLRYLFATPGNMPTELQIEITNRCNLDCDMCPRNSKKATNGDMPMETFSHIVRNLSSIDTIILTGWGEPFLHPHIFDMIKIIKEKHRRIKVKLTSNGHLLDENVSKALIAHNVDAITFSVDRIVESSRSSSGHPVSKKVQDNIKNLSCLRISGIPEIRIQTVLFPGGYQDVLDVISFARAVKADAVNLVRMDTRHGSRYQRLTLKEERKTIVDAARIARTKGVRVVSANLQSLPIRIAAHFDRICLRTMHSAYITFDGKVTPCCDLRQYAVGELAKDDLPKIWNGASFKNFRKNQRKACDRCDALRYGHLY